MQGKTVFITGVSTGIGKASAFAFAKAGARIIGCARNEERLKAVEHELKQAFPDVETYFFALDVSDRTAVASTIQQLPEDFQTIDVLLNNAGLACGRERIDTAKIEDWETMIDINVKGLLYVTRQILPGMVERGTGTVINIGSIAGRAAYPGGNIYCATKAAVRMISDAIRVDLVGTGVRASDIEPAMVKTEFEFHRSGDRADADARYSKFRVLDAEDVAGLALYIASAPPHVCIQEALIASTDQATALVVRN